VSGPYREPGRDDDVPDEEARPLVRLDVAGADGRKGRDGRDGAAGHRSGADGQAGEDAGAPTRGHDGGTIRVTLAAADGLLSVAGELAQPDELAQPMRTTALIGERGDVVLAAYGGRGGNGGRGGRGGHGARGSDGSDATRSSHGTEGGDGGDGGRGGRGTSGADGGRGGAIVVRVADADTALLMLVRADVRGGAGGDEGDNGRGGDGGRGGSGGSSYSWSETETTTDASGHSHTRTTWHSHPGGPDGRRGRDGTAGDAYLQRGAIGAAGSFAIEVAGPTGVTRHGACFALRLDDFRHAGAYADDVHEPGEDVIVRDLRVLNVGGMPTPSRSELLVGLAPSAWLEPGERALPCPPSIASGATAAVAGELRARIRDHVATEPGASRLVQTTLRHRAWVPAVNRGFDDFETARGCEQVAMAADDRLPTTSMTRSST
jgi:hypothetical protein